MTNDLYGVHVAFARIQSASFLFEHLLDSMSDNPLLRDQIRVVAAAIHAFAEQGGHPAHAIEKGG